MVADQFMLKQHSTVYEDLNKNGTVFGESKPSLNKVLHNLEPWKYFML